MVPEVARFQKWLLRKYPQSSTPVHYINDMELFFEWVGKAPADVGVRDVDQFIERSRALGHSINTINRRLASLRAFYEFLDMDVEAAPPNPVIPRRHFIRKGLRLPRDVEDKQLVKLFEVIDSARDRAMFLLMLRCGMRVGEIRNLTLGDLYLNPSPGKLPRIRLVGKGGVERIVYLAAQPLAALKAWLDMRPQASDQAVFLNRFGWRMTVTGIQFRLAQHCRRADTWITCHQFRHTFGRHLAEARIPVTSIQRLLGHARIATSEIYLRISDVQVQADYDVAMAKVAARLASAGGVA